MNIEEAEKNVGIIRKLLIDWRNYFVFLVIGLGYWLYKYDKKIDSLESEEVSLKREHKVEIDTINNRHRREMNAYNCIEQFKQWKQAIDNDIDKIKQRELSEVQSLRERNKNIEETINLIDTK